MFTQLFRVADPHHNLHDVQRQFEALFSGPARPRRSARTPAFDVFDDGDGFRLVADVPGLGAEDLDLEVTEEGLTVRGTRAVKAPEGFSVHRRERSDLDFARTFNFPTKVDPEQVSATLEQGVLTITLAKRADTKPRSITVRSVAA